ncbi:hypothetical protein [Pseudomonas leptonychotis]
MRSLPQWKLARTSCKSCRSTHSRNWRLASE